MKKSDRKSPLKTLAADAKARMKSGYHTQAEGDSEQNESYFDVVKKSFKTGAEIRRDAEFYAKVREILKDETVLNPISRLIDEDYMKTLDYSAKQRYLLEISEKFKKAKEDIEREAKEVTT